MSIRGLVRSSVALVAAVAATIAPPSMAAAAEKVSVAIISFSPYATWYIIKERNLAKDIDLDIKIIEGNPREECGNVLRPAAVHE
jgi:NitT/TauT family transport system substrate-binding protein